MSHLSIPRLHFTGDFLADVFTANNDDIAVLDNSLQYVDSAQVKIDTRGMSDTNFQQWIRGDEPGFGIRGGWNLYGSGRCSFSNVKIVSAELPNQGLVQDVDVEPLIGSKVQLLSAVMVDLDPESALSTQIFCERFSVQNGNIQINGEPSTFHSRWVAKRSLSQGGFSALGCVWHASISPEALGISGDSPTLEVFRQAMQAGAGLFIRFSSYSMKPSLSNDDYKQQINSGIAPYNPALGRVTGSIGLWSPEEMRTSVSGRRLHSHDTAAIEHQAVALNPAVAELDEDRNVISVDLIHSIPELNESLQKVDLGDLSLMVEVKEQGEARVEAIGPILYSADRYLSNGGIAEVATNATKNELIKSGRLLLVQESTGAQLLREQAITIDSDDRNIYLNDEQSYDITVRAFENGQSAKRELTVNVSQVSTANRTTTDVPPAEPIVSVQKRLTISEGGTAKLRVTAVAAGMCRLVFTLADSIERSDFFCNIRVLPKDSYAHISDAQLNFEFVYREVLQFYYLLFPSMDQVFPLNSESTVIGEYERILNRISKSVWNKAEYMPVSRDLSDGKRDLLTRYLSKISAQPVVHASATDLISVKGVGPTLAKLLQSNGISTVEQLAKTDKAQLAGIPGIGLNSGSRMIESASLILGITNSSKKS